MTAEKNTVTFDGIREMSTPKYRQGCAVALTDTFVRQVKPVKKVGDKYVDGGGMYLLVTESAYQVAIEVSWSAVGSRRDATMTGTALLVAVVISLLATLTSAAREFLSVLAVARAPYKKQGQSVPAGREEREASHRSRLPLSHHERVTSQIA